MQKIDAIMDLTREDLLFIRDTKCMSLLDEWNGLGGLIRAHHTPGRKRNKSTFARTLNHK